MQLNIQYTDKRKILLLIKIPPPLTGATYINTLVRDSSFLKNSFDIHSICMSYSDTVSELGKNYSIKIFKYCQYIFKLLKILIQDEIGFIYLQLSPLGISFLRDFSFVILIKMFRVKLVYHLHGTGIKKSAEKNFLLKLLYIIAFSNETIICLSNKLAYDVDFIVDKKIFIVPNAVQAIVKSVTMNTSKNSHKLNIVYISNLFKFKGIFDLLDSLFLLLKNQLLFTCYIVGDEGDVTKEELFKRLDILGLNKFVKYLGPKFGEKKNEILSSADIMIYPTHNDAMPLVILEAFQFNIPVIASDIGAISDIIDDGISGFLIRNIKPDQIAEKVELLNNNRELLLKMGIAARNKYEEKYRLEIFEKNMKAVFDKVLQEVNGEKNV